MLGIEKKGDVKGIREQAMEALLLRRQYIGKQANTIDVGGWSKGPTPDYKHQRAIMQFTALLNHIVAWLSASQIVSLTAPHA